MPRAFVVEFAVGFLCAGLALVSVVRGDELADAARKLPFNSIVVDTHDDTTQRLIAEKLDLARRDTRGHIDIPRMREGGLSELFFSILMPCASKSAAIRAIWCWRQPAPKCAARTSKRKSPRSWVSKADT